MCKPYERQASEINSRLINVKEFVDFVKAVKGGNEDKIIVSSIIGYTGNPETPYGLFERPSVFGGTELDIQPTCSEATTGSAAPGLRLEQFTKSFRNNTVATICQADLKDAMKQIGEKFALVLENTCITSPLVDTDLDQGGCAARLSGAGPRPPRRGWLHRAAAAPVRVRWQPLLGADPRHRLRIGLPDDGQAARTTRPRRPAPCRSCSA